MGERLHATKGLRPPDGSLDWFLSCTSRLGLAAWGFDCAGRAVFLNTRGEALLGWRDGAWSGRGQHEVICGGEPGAEQDCRQNCLVVRRFLTRVGPEPPLEPTMVRCGLRSGRNRWLLVFSARVDAGGEESPVMLQLAHDTSRIHVMVGYLSRIASRSAN